jgi:plasmid stabilization system protein ParE
MSFYKLTERDVFEIWDYIAEDNVDAADLVLDYLHAHCLLLSKTPTIGRLREDFASNLYVLPVGKNSWRSRYLVFYQPTEIGIEVMQIVESHRNITDELFKTD